MTEASRGRFLIDGEEVFTAVYRELIRARKVIYISGWDIDTRIRLVPPEMEHSRYPARLADLFNALVLDNPELVVHVLIWSPAPVYYAERENFTGFKFKWQTHSRVIFHRDRAVPVGGSLHRKMILIDDRVAFCGGMDLTANRWDRPEHRDEEPARINPWGKSYGPFHDVQVRVEGRVVQDLSELFRMRWRQVTGVELPVVGSSRAGEPAESLAPGPAGEGSGRADREPQDFPAARVAVARTEPQYRGGGEIREVEALYLDLIRVANRLIYIENQFLSSGRVAGALARSLEQERGPEVLIVIPLASSSFMEELAMKPFQVRVIESLQRADRFGRLMITGPVSAEGKPVMVHSKIAVFDEDYAIVGSANLANRSMGVDLEVILAIEGRGAPAVSEAIGRFRNRLVGEHLGIRADELARSWAPGDGYLERVRQRVKSGKGRRLVPVETGAGPEWTRKMLPEIEIIDLEHSIEEESLVHEFAYDRRGRFGRFLRTPTFYIGTFLGLLILAVTLLWTLTPLKEFLRVERLVAEGERLLEAPYTALWVLAVYLIGGLLFIPVNLLILATATVFKGPLALFYAVTGSLLNAAGGYLLGAILGYRVIDRIFGEAVRKLGGRFSEKGILPVVVIRMLPIAPFSAVNLVAGAARVRPASFFLGTFFGLLPGISALVFFQRSLVSVLMDPEPVDALMLAAFVIVFLWFLNVVRRRFGREARP